MTAAAIALVLATAGNGVDRVYISDACSEAASFGADEGPAAEQARRRCRLEMFARRLTSERQHKAAEQAARRDAWIRDWIEKNRPVRDRRPYAVDGFAGLGLASYGLAVSWVPSTAIELEPWVGWAKGSYTWFEIQRSDGPVRGGVQDSRFAAGMRAKWLMLERNLTPFVSAGVGAAWANIEATVDLSAVNPAAPTWKTGTGRSHQLTASAGAQVMFPSGIRLSGEYFFAAAFYTQASAPTEWNPHDDDLRQMWSAKLEDDRHGIRFQVGYGF